MNNSPIEFASVKTVRDYLMGEIERARAQLLPDHWQVILVGVSDQGALAVYPCRLVLPFHYPASHEELDQRPTAHFSFPRKPLWSLRLQLIRDFAEQSERLAVLNDNTKVTVAAKNEQRRIGVLRDACNSFDPALTILGIESGTETWWEVNTFHISGPQVPSPPAPVSDVQLLARLCRHTHSHVGRHRFQMENGAIVGVSFDGADTTDSTIDLLRNVPRLRELLGKLRRLSLQSTLVTDRSLKFLEWELPHVEIEHSHFLEG